ncbi:perilipin-2 [Trichomycterus rosablanca]|uniref:perilipin-2 n=1 Tax=Trichomycterus rosablanca TaxID=2290929 RepID=UPI002F350A6E
MAPNEMTQNVVTRVVQLPLVSSTYDMVLNMYGNTKENHPYIKSVCEAAEVGVKTITTAAFTSALPIIGKLEPQISRVNDLACKGLDKIENSLPILHQPPEQIVASAKGAVTESVNGAKTSMSHTLGDVMVRTRGAVQESVEKTRMAVSDGVDTVMKSKMAKIVSSSVNTALSTSETLVERYLPAPEEIQEHETNLTKGFEHDADEHSYYVRLGSLSTKLRQRAYKKAISKVLDAKKHSQESISKLNHTMDLIEYTRKNIDGANQKIYEKLSTVMDLKSTSQSTIANNSESDAEIIESRTLTIARNLTQQLQTTCVALATSLQGLPQNVQEQAVSISHMAIGVYTRFNKAAALGDLSDSVLTNTRAQLSRMKESIDNVMDYLVNNTPLNWLVGPFYPHIEPTTKPSSTQSSEESSAQPELEMQLILKEN